ncbi:MAG TPA: 5,10-methylenetetrahydrofolate reductase [Firmicutes bacterium]|jgi:5,10-methylenetetrahydrofolate reductase|nr:5,10-methylenetetrahydrofolate reductase [Candidatus Fermentithermobacillaceae bacterium]
MVLLARLYNKLMSGQFAVTVEMDPPKGADPRKTLEKVRKFSDRVDAVNVADCPMANVRMSPITVAHLIQRDANVEAIFHLTCRDRNVIGLQAELLGAAGLGVRNILALRGDEPTRGDHPEARGVFEVDTPGLIRLAAELNHSRTVAGSGLERGTELAIGCAANPTARDLEFEVSRLEAKIEAGAHFVQTQPLFDLRDLERWLTKIQGRIKVPILYGVMPLKNYNFAVHLNNNVPGIDVPSWIVDRLRNGAKGEGIRIAAELIKSMAPLVSGVHIFPMNSPERVVALLQALDETRGFEKEAVAGGAR